MSSKPTQILTVTNAHGTFAIHRRGFDHMLGLGMGSDVHTVTATFAMIGMWREAEEFANAHRAWQRASEAQDALKAPVPTNPTFDDLLSGESPEWRAAAAATWTAWCHAQKKLKVLTDAVAAIKAQIDPEEFVIA